MIGSPRIPCQLELDFHLTLLTFGQAEWLPMVMIMDPCLALSADETSRSDFQDIDLGVESLLAVIYRNGWMALDYRGNDYEGDWMAYGYSSTFHSVFLPLPDYLPR